MIPNFRLAPEQLFESIQRKAQLQNAKSSRFFARAVAEICSSGYISSIGTHNCDWSMKEARFEIEILRMLALIRVESQTKPRYRHVRKETQ